MLLKVKIPTITHEAEVLTVTMPVGVIAERAHGGGR